MLYYKFVIQMRARNEGAPLLDKLNAALSELQSIKTQQRNDRDQFEILR